MLLNILQDFEQLKGFTHKVLIFGEESLISHMVGYGSHWLVTLFPIASNNKLYIKISCSKYGFSSASQFKPNLFLKQECSAAINQSSNLVGKFIIPMATSFLYYIITIYHHQLPTYQPW
jgi:hypothetical protein